MIKILLISNDELLYDFCRKLQDEHISVQCVSSFSSELVDFFYHVSLVFFDFELIKNGDNVLLEQICFQSGKTPVLSLVQECSIGLALRILNGKCLDNISLPCCIEYLRESVYRYCNVKNTESTNKRNNSPVDSFIGNTAEILDLKRKLLLISQSELSVLILGETGTGKSYIARIIHQLSSRCKNNFVEENIAAIQDTLVEGELFGTKVGAYTGAVSRKGLFEHANDGTLFLDEISCIKTNIQAKLLQVLETGQFRPVGEVKKRTSNVRIISATNQPLEILKTGKAFRDDLYYRISGVQLYIPALRTRKADIAPLAKHFLKKLSEKTGIIKELRGDAIIKLELHDWPGNVRELERCIECAYFLSSTAIITGRDIVFVS